MSYAQLRDIAKFYSGGTPSKSSADFWGGDIPWVSPKDMGSDRILDAEDHITEAAISGSATRLMPSDTLLIVNRSGILVRRIPVALTMRPVTFNQDIRALVVDRNRALPEFVFWFLKARESQILARGVKLGATVHSIASGFLENLALLVPPLDQQRRIVDLLTRAASIRRLAETAEARARALPTALFVDMFGSEPTDRWETFAFGDLATQTQLGLVRSSAQTKEDHPLPYVRMNSISDDGDLNLTGLKRVEATPQEIERYKLRQGDFLFNTRNTRELVGKTAVFDATGIYLFNNNIMRVRFDSRVDPQFMVSAFQTEQLQRELEIRKSGTTSVFAIYYKNLVTLRVPVPPRSMQTIFAERVKEINGIRVHAARAVATADALTNSLMADLFAD